MAGKKSSVPSTPPAASSTASSLNPSAEPRQLPTDFPDEPAVEGCYSSISCMILRPLLVLALLAALGQPQSRSIIIDTDAGSDDFLAIAFLLSHPSVHIDAITVANGLAHVDAGTRNLARLVELSGRSN